MLIIVTMITRISIDLYATKPSGEVRLSAISIAIIYRIWIAITFRKLFLTASTR